MKKIDLFFVIALVLFSGLAISYVAFDYHLSGIVFEKSKNKILSSKVNQLNVVIESMQIYHQSQKRGLASIQPTKEISLDHFYKQQLRAARTEKNDKKISRVATKIISSSTNAEVLAEAYFSKAFVNCETYLLKENSCLADIEVLVEQFPESQWSAEGLLVLSLVYVKQKKYKEVGELLKIVKSEFKNHNELIEKVKAIEKISL